MGLILSILCGAAFAGYLASPIMRLEVRRLAEKSMGSTKEISALIGEIENSIRAAVDSVNDGSEAVNEGTKVAAEAERNAASVGEVARSTDQISAAARIHVRLDPVACLDG